MRTFKKVITKNLWEIPFKKVERATGRRSNRIGVKILFKKDSVNITVRFCNTGFETTEKLLCDLFVSDCGTILKLVKNKTGDTKIYKNHFVIGRHRIPNVQSGWHNFELSSDKKEILIWPIDESEK